MDQEKQKVTIVKREEVVYQHFYSGFPFVETTREPRAGRSREQIAHDLLSSSTAYAFWLETTIETSVIFDEREVWLISAPCITLRTYVGGTIYTLEEVQATYPEQRTFIENLAQAGSHVHAIHTRAGNWLELYDTDSFLDADCV